MGIHIFRFLSDSYILESIQLYTRVVNLLNKNEHFKDKNIQKSTQDVSEKYEGAEEFINSRIEEICFQEKLSVEEVIYFLSFLVSFLAVKCFFNIKV